MVCLQPGFQVGPGRWRARSLAVFGLAAGLSCADSCACGSAEVARLAERDGAVERNVGRPAVGQPDAPWSEAAIGVPFITGDAVRTLDRSRARLSMSGGGSLQLGSRTTIRFLAERPGADSARLRVEAGQAEVEAGDQPLGVETARGAARLDRRGRLRVSLDEDGNARLEILVGTAVIEDDTEAGVPPLLAGDSALIGPGGAILRRWREGEAAISPDAGVAPGTSTLTAAAALEPPPADLSIEANESVIIHDPQAPSRVRVRFADLCPAEGEVRVFGPRGQVVAEVRGTLEVVVVVPHGTYRYEVRCAGQTNPVARGRMRVADGRDPSELARPPDTVRLEADGGSRRVRYAGPAPGMSFSWPNPPQVDAFVLVLRRRGELPQRFASEDARWNVPPGALSDGRYEWWFEAAESDRASSPSVLDLGVDRDAPVAEVTVQRREDGTVEVSGRAFAGARVTAEGQSLPLDAQQRFAGAVRTSSAARSISVRVAHPTRGTQIFVRPLEEKVAP